MIITKNSPLQPQQQPQQQPQAPSQNYSYNYTAGPSSSAPLSTPPGPPPYNHAIHTVPMPKAPGERYPLYTYNVGSRTRRRFFETFIVAVAVCFVFSLTGGVINKVAREIAGGIDWVDSEWSIPSKYHEKTCISGRDWEQYDNSGMYGYPYSAKTSLELPSTSERLFFVSTGAQQTGNLKITTIPSDGEKVKVDVDMHFRTPTALRLAGACLLSGASRENGIGLFTPRRWEWGRNLVYFEVTVRLPTGGQSPLVIDELQTDMSNYSVDLDSLHGVEFRKLDLKSSNGHIEAQSLSADDIKVVTSNAGIKGSYKTSTSLILQTSNAGVKADISLLNNNTRPTMLKVHTSNGAIDSSVSMYSTQKSKTGGTFIAELSSSNAPITLDLPVSPLDAKVQLKASTSNSPARVSLSAGYEGEYELSTSSYFQPSLEQGKAEDPSGKERRRSVTTTRTGRGQLAGRVNWVPAGEGAEDSYVRVRTSNSNVALRL